MNIKVLLNLNILFVAYGTSQGFDPSVVSHVESSENFDELSEGMSPEMKARMKEASVTALQKIKELSNLDEEKRGYQLQKMGQTMTTEEAEMIRIMFENVERKTAINKIAV